MFRELSAAEQEQFRQWAREHYVPGQLINEQWHPIVREECEQINREHFGKR